MSEQNYASWPIDPRFRRFYRQEEIGGYFYLVPADRLGRGQIDGANKSRKDAALEILKDKSILGSIRELRKQELEQSIASANVVLSETKDLDVKDSCARMLVLLRATVVPDDGEATEQDAAHYVNTHKSDTPIIAAWFGALWIPLADAPKISEIWTFIPQYLIEGTLDFFVESQTAPTPKSSETIERSAG